MLSEVKLVTLGVSDLDQACAFYARAMGYQVEESGPVPAALAPLWRFDPALGGRYAVVAADGSGLGLPIVREIARQHGADVELEDARPGSAMPGARFTVRFTASNGGG